MKRKIWFQHLLGAAFAFALSVSAIGCLITGYELKVDSLGELYLWCAGFALGSAAFFRFRHGGWIMAGLAVVALGFLWGKEAVWQQTRFLAYIITSHYHVVYRWPVLGTPDGDTVFWPLILWAALTAVCVNWHICRRKHILLAILPVVLPLVLCLVTIDKVPEEVYLFILMLGIAALLISDWTRTHVPAQGMPLLIRCVLPVAVFLAALFVMNPRGEYVNKAGAFQQEVVSWFQELRQTTESVVSTTPVTLNNSEKLNLRSVGPKNKRAYSVMAVNSTLGGTLYLRGRDYDGYTGTGWEATSDRREVFTSGGASDGKVTIVTYGVRNVRYVPYYPAEEIELSGGARENRENLQRYSYDLSGADLKASDLPGSRYTQLPEDTLTWAEERLKEITDGALSEQEKALRIAGHVGNSAVYDLSTTRMDSGYDDFARWFLEESETGYCVHFATATVVLLRAAGIPARYVEGYMVNCDAGMDTVVTNRDAHAWAEYYDSDSGIWRILEATPADPEEEETEPAQSIPETDTSPEETWTETESPATVPTDTGEIPVRQPLDRQDAPGQTGEKEGFRIPDWIGTVFKILLVVLCVPLQSIVRIKWKRRLWNRGGENERAIRRWCQTRSLAKILRQPYPEELEAIAQKAKFSQHRIQPEELQQFDAYRHSLIAQVSSKPWYQKWLLRWILAVG